MIEITIDLDESILGLETKLLDAVCRHLNGVMQHVRSGVLVGIQDLCDKLIEQTPEFHALINRDLLLGELGVPDIDHRLTQMLEAVKRGIVAEVVPVRRQGNDIGGGLFIGIIPSELYDILSLPESSYQTEKGQTIPWLEWLTQMGDRIIVWGYDVSFKGTAIKARSRTGLALMVKGNGWRVPPQFSGVNDDNFFTRAFDVPGVEREIAKIILNEITKRL